MTAPTPEQQALLNTYRQEVNTTSTTLASAQRAAALASQASDAAMIAHTSNRDELYAAARTASDQVTAAAHAHSQALSRLTEFEVELRRQAGSTS